MKLHELPKSDAEAIMRGAGKVLAHFFKQTKLEKVMFGILVFSGDDDTFWVANCLPEDLVSTLRETADRIEDNTQPNDFLNN